MFLRLPAISNESEPCGFTPGPNLFRRDAFAPRRPCLAWTFRMKLRDDGRGTTSQQAGHIGQNAHGVTGVMQDHADQGRIKVEPFEVQRGRVRDDPPDLRNPTLILQAPQVRQGVGRPIHSAHESVRTYSVRKHKTHIAWAGTGVQHAGTSPKMQAIHPFRNEAGAQLLAGKHFIPVEMAQILPVRLLHDMAPLNSELPHGPAGQAESYGDGCEVDDAHPPGPP